MTDTRGAIAAFFERSRATFDRAQKDDAMLAVVAKTAETIAQAFRRGDHSMKRGISLCSAPQRDRQPAQPKPTASGGIHVCECERNA